MSAPLVIAVCIAAFAGCYTFAFALLRSSRRGDRAHVYDWSRERIFDALDHPRVQRYHHDRCTGVDCGHTRREHVMGAGPCLCSPICGCLAFEEPWDVTFAELVDPAVVARYRACV